MSEIDDLRKTYKAAPKVVVPETLKSRIHSMIDEYEDVSPRRSKRPLQYLATSGAVVAALIIALIGITELQQRIGFPVLGHGDAQQVLDVDTLHRTYGIEFQVAARDASKYPVSKTEAIDTISIYKQSGHEIPTNTIVQFGYATNVHDGEGMSYLFPGKVVTHYPVWVVQFPTQTFFPHGDDRRRSITVPDHRYLFIDASSDKVLLYLPISQVAQPLTIPYQKDLIQDVLAGSYNRWYRITPTVIPFVGKQYDTVSNGASHGPGGIVSDALPSGTKLFTIPGLDPTTQAIAVQEGSEFYEAVLLSTYGDNGWIHVSNGYYSVSSQPADNVGKLYGIVGENSITASTLPKGTKLYTINGVLPQDSHSTGAIAVETGNGSFFTAFWDGSRRP